MQQLNGLLSTTTTDDTEHQIVISIQYSIFMQAKAKAKANWESTNDKNHI
jgi:hypothetical protein